MKEERKSKEKGGEMGDREMVDGGMEGETGGKEGRGSGIREEERDSAPLIFIDIVLAMIPSLVALTYEFQKTIL